MIYWITWQLGTTAYCDHEDLSSFTVYNLMDLEDGWNPPEILAGRMLRAMTDMGAGKRVIFMCAAGISRSNGLTMGVLSAYHNLAFDDAKKIVEAFCPRANPMPDLLRAVEKAVKLVNEGS